MMGKHHIIYRTTNLLNNRYYIGMHSTENIDDGYLGSGRRIKAEIKKYGKDYFVREVLEELPTYEALKLREKEIVNEALLADPLNINLKIGGEGGGKFIDAEHQQKCCKAGGLAGGSRVAWERHRAKMAKAVSDVMKRRHLIGFTTSGTTGKRFKKTPGSASGKKNSQYGSCWVTKDGNTIKIQQTDLDDHLAQGFCRGRK